MPVQGHTHRKQKTGTMQVRIHDEVRRHSFPFPEKGPADLLYLRYQLIFTLSACWIRATVNVWRMDGQLRADLRTCASEGASVSRDNSR